MYDNTNGTIDFHNEQKNVYGKSFIQLYEKRSEKYKDMNIDTYARCVKVTNTSNEMKEEEIPKKQQDKVALMFQPRYPSSRSSKIYWKYCKYSLIRYKTFTNLNEMFDENTTEEEYIQRWKSFLKDNPSVISNWEKRLNDAEYVLECIDNGEDILSDEKRYDEDYVWFKKHVREELIEKDAVNVCRDMEI